MYGSHAYGLATPRDKGFHVRDSCTEKGKSCSRLGRMEEVHRKVREVERVPTA